VTDSPQTVHVPILVGPIVEALLEPLRALPQDCGDQWIVDCTLGGGGHTRALLDALGADPRLAKHHVLSIDQDSDAIERARIRFARELDQGRLRLVHARFGESADALEGLEVGGLMADLGFSSDQLEDGERGLSFSRPGPLDMRLDPTRGESAREFLARASEKQIADVIFELAEERLSRKIAAAIVKSRTAGQLPRTTAELAELVSRVFPPSARHGRIHPATRTFQALRIYVNQELEELDSLLGDVILRVKPGGRVAIISFHSLEDRKVKQRFKGEPGRPDVDFLPLTKKPIEADEEELRMNPRSRSAKLRIAERRSPGATR